jgi:di/tripeptidase
MNGIRERVLDEFIRIVQIDSLSLKEAAMFDYLRKRLAGLGWAANSRNTSTLRSERSPAI